MGNVLVGHWPSRLSATIGWRALRPVRSRAASCRRTGHARRFALGPQRGPPRRPNQRRRGPEAITCFNRSSPRRSPAELGARGRFPVAATPSYVPVPTLGLSKRQAPILAFRAPDAISHGSPFPSQVTPHGNGPWRISVRQMASVGRDTTRTRHRVAGTRWST